MKILILGLGSIAQKHINALLEIDKNIEIFALRSSNNSKNNNRVINLYNWSGVKAHNFNFAIVSTPSFFHLENILKLDELKIPLMIEKPIFINNDQINKFNKYNLSLNKSYVACNMRFHPLIVFLKNYLNSNYSKINEVNSYCGSFLPEWRGNKDYKNIYSSKKSLGGGVNLDLIHEPDYLIYLFDFPNSSYVFNNKFSELNIDSYDSSNIVFKYDDFNAQITLNYFRKDSKRTLEIVRDKDTIFVDFIKNKIVDLLSGEELFSASKNSLKQSYLDQMKYFLNCIKNDKTPINSVQEAVSVLKLVI